MRLTRQGNFFNRLLKGSGWVLLLSLTACQQPNQSQKPSDNKPKTEEQQKSHLTLNKATLEQANSKGQTIWKIQVQEAIYSPDQKTAQLKKIRGNLLQDGKVVLQVSADNGELVRDGEEVFLKNNIIAVDPRNKTVIRSQEVEWRPREDVLIVRKSFKGSHPQLEATAKEGKYYTRQQRVELNGNIVATANNPRLQLKTEQLAWKVAEQKVIGDRPFIISRYQENTISDRLAANRIEWQIKTKQVLAQENIEYKSLNPPLQMATNSLIWNYRDRIVKADQPIQLLQYQEQVTLTGNQGEVNLVQKVAKLSGGVQGNNNRTQAKLYANDLTWNIASQTLEAVGNVIYEQAKPKFNLTGEKAIGTLNNNNITVTGNTQERVVTEIYPDSKN